MKKLLPILLISVLLLSGCMTNSPDSTDNTNDITENTSSETAENTNYSNINSDMFTDRDYKTDYDKSKSVLIKLNGDSISCTSDAVQISGTTATITDEGTYILTGTLNNGMIVVNADKKDKPQLVFKDVTINSETSAPLYILQADKVFVTLAPNSSNKLSNGGTFTAIDDNNIDGAVFSKQDLTLNGSGSLTVTSPSGHGIVCKDDLVFTSGTYTINSASHGLDANDSVRIANASITINSGKDGIHSDNSDDENLGFVYIASGTLDISAEGDGISAEAYMKIEDGSFDIISGGGSINATKEHSDNWGNFMGGGPGGRRSDEVSTTTDTNDDSSTSIKGIKASGDIQIKGGTFNIDSADDAVHSNSSITVSGGTFEIASGDDGFHADETLTVTGGTINITESYEGLEALELNISGGDITLIATDDGLNAAGGTDSSGFGGPRENDSFGGGPGGRGGFGGGGEPGSSSNGKIVISGGKLNITASGDGIDSNGTLEISGGNITVCGPTVGDTATLDFDVSGVITGGTFIGTGASGMAQTFSSSEQGVISVNVGNESVGTEITLKDKSGNTIISHKPELDFAVVILSSPEIVSGETYTLTVGSSSKEFTAD